MSAAIIQADSRGARSLWIAGAIGAGYIAIHLGGIFGVTLGRAPWALVAAMVLAQTWLSTGLFIVAHDCMHGSFAPGRPRLNRGVGRLALMLYAGIDFDRMLPAHFAHHRHTGTAQDPDFDAKGPTRALPWLFRFFIGYYTHAQLLRITLAACLWLLLGANLLNIVIFWAVPALLALCQLFWFGTYLPHRHAAGADGDRFADRHRARSTPLPRWLSALTCFHFGGYHHEHHLSPGTPWWRLPKVIG